MAEDPEQSVKELKDWAGDVPVSWNRPRPRRVYVEVDRDDLREFARGLFDDYGARFVTATGTDMGERLEVVYHFSDDPSGLMINLRVTTPRAENTIPALTPVIECAEWIEREMRDLLGIEFEGHPRPERLILSDDWPEGDYPLRKEE